MTFTSNLSRNNHCHHVRSKVTSRLFALERFCRSLNINTRLQFIYAFILPLVIFCLPVWGNAQAAITNDMNTIIKRCMKFLTSNAVSDFNNFSCEKLGLVIFTDIVLVLRANAIAQFNHIHFNTDIAMTISYFTSGITRASQSNKI